MGGRAGDYFWRQVMKFSSVDASDEQIANAKKVEYMLRRKLTLVLQDFKEERAEFQRQTKDEMPHSDFSHRLMSNEIQDTSDGVKEIMKVLRTQQEMMHNQWAVIKQ